MNKSIHWSATLAVIFSCCTSSSDSSTKTQISIYSHASMTVIGIYFMSADSVRVNSFVEQAKKWLPDFGAWDEMPDSVTANGFITERYTDLTKDFTPPDNAFLRYSGVDLNEDEKVKFQHAKSALVVRFLATKENILEKQRKITSLIGSLVKDKPWIIADFNTAQFFNATSWQTHRVDRFIGNNMLKQIVVHVYREEEFCRIVTMGMGKFCLPDISIKNMSCMDEDSFGGLVNTVVATWIQNPQINVDSSLFVDLQKISDEKLRKKLTADINEGAELKVELKLRRVKPEEGDSPNRQLGIVFENPSFSSPQEEQNDVLKKLFGIKESYVEVGHNEEILKASEKAKAKLPELQRHFNAGLEPGYSLLLKAPFKTDDGGNEWMWLEVTRWVGGEIEGILQNEPVHVSGLKSGSKVRVNQEVIFDYALNKPDGTTEGNETGKILDEMN